MTDNEWRTRVDSLLRDIEKRVNSVERKGAVDEVHRANVEKRLTGIEVTLHRLVWLIIVSLVGAIMTFIVGGGLSL